MKFLNRTWLLGAFLITLLAMSAHYPSLKKGVIIAPTDIQEAFLYPWADDDVRAHNHSTSDAVTQYVPYRMFYEKAYQEDGYIGWNPYEMCGVNMAGNTMATPGAWSTQLHRFFSLENAWNWGIIAEFIIAGLGMFTFLYDRKLSFILCLLGGVMFMWNSQFHSWINHRWMLGSFCWMPWVLWASRDIFIEKFKLRHAALPLFLAAAMLGGSLQHIAFIVLACSCLVLARCSRSNRLFIDWSYALKWSALFIMVFCMAGYSLFPQIQAYFINTEMGHVRGGIGYPGGLKQIFLNMIVIPAQVWPWLMGDPQTIDTSSGLRLGFMNIAFVGTIPMILALISVFYRGLPREAKLLILFGLLFPLTPLVGPLYHRVQLLFILGACWMVPELLNAVISDKFKLPIKLIRNLYILVSTALVALTVIMLVYKDVIVAKLNQVIASSGQSMQFDPDGKWLDDRVDAWISRFSLLNIQTAAVFILLSLSVVALFMIYRKHAKIGLLLLLVVTGSELIIFKQKAVSYGKTSVFSSPQKEIESLRELASDGRILQEEVVESIADGFAPPNILSSHSVATINAYESIQYPSIYKTTREEDRQMSLALSNVSHTIVLSEGENLDEAKDWTKVLSFEKHSVYRNNDYLGFLLSIKEDNVPQETKNLYTVLKTSEALSLVEKTMSSMKFSILPETKHIRVAQNWHEGWKWRYVGETSWNEVVKGCDSACYIEVQGESGGQVEMIFKPINRLFIIISMIGGLMYLAFCVFQTLKNARSTA